MNKWKKVMICTLTAALLMETCLQVQADTYTYDELNRLKSVTYEDGSKVEYEYDANGNMKESRVYDKQKAEEEAKKKAEEEAKKKAEEDARKKAEEEAKKKTEEEKKYKLFIKIIKFYKLYIKKKKTEQLTDKNHS